MPPRSPTTVGMAVETTVISIAAIERLSKSEMTVSGRFVFIDGTMLQMLHPRPRCNVPLDFLPSGFAPGSRSPPCYFATAKPESATAFSRSAGFAFAASYLTTTWPFSRSAEADSTPFSCFSLASVFAGHFSHFQPLTLIVSVFAVASAAVVRPRLIARTNDAVFMGRLLLREMQKRSYRPRTPRCQRRKSADTAHSPPNGQRLAQARESGCAAVPRPRDAHPEHPPFGFRHERRSFVPECRGVRVDTHRSRLAFPLRMHSPVLEHVADGLEGLARRLQEVGVVAVREHRPPPRHHLVECPRHPHLAALQGAPESDRIGSLDDEGQVVPLDGEVHEPEPEPFAAALKGELDRPEAPVRAKFPDFPAHAHGDVQRAPAEPPAGNVRNILAQGLPLPASAAPGAAPEGKREVLLDRIHVRSVRGGP